MNVDPETPVQRARNARELRERTILRRIAEERHRLRRMAAPPVSSRTAYIRWARARDGFVAWDLRCLFDASNAAQKMTFSRALGRLVEQGLVETTNRTGSRNGWVRLTDDGEALLARVANFAEIPSGIESPVRTRWAPSSSLAAEFGRISSHAIVVANRASIS